MPDDLRKSKGPPTFPKLGIEDRRETPALEPGSLSHRVKVRATVNASRYVGEASPELARVWAEGVIGGTVGVPGQNQFSWAVAPARKPGVPETRTHGTVQHENFHGIMNRVGEEFGQPARNELARHLVEDILPPKCRESLERYMRFKLPGNNPDRRFYHEEKIAHLLNYLNDPAVRRRFNRNLYLDNPDPFSGDNAGMAHDRNLKLAYRLICNAAKRIDPVRLFLLTRDGGFIEKAEPAAKEPPPPPMSGWDFTPGVAKRGYKAATPGFVDRPSKIMHHVPVPGMNNPEQLSLLNSIDFPNATRDQAPTTDGGRIRLRMKSVEALDEALFHNAAHYVFGLGHHVPLTAVTSLEGKNEFASAVHWIPHELTIDPNDGYALNAALAPLHEDGTLHKLALMEHIMGSSYDRHALNYLVTKEPYNGTRLHLIDNELLEFPRRESPSGVPDYLWWRTFGGPANILWRDHRDDIGKRKGVAPLDEPVSQDTLAWLEQLDPKRLEQVWRSHGSHHHFQDKPASSIARLLEAQALARLVPNPTLGQLFWPREHLEAAGIDSIDEVNNLYKSESESMVAKMLRPLNATYVILLRAAEFLSGRLTDQQKARRAWKENEDDLEAAALIAHGFDPTDKNRQALRAIAEQDEPLPEIASTDDPLDAALESLKKSEPAFRMPLPYDPRIHDDPWRRESDDPNWKPTGPLNRKSIYSKKKKKE